MLRVGHIAGSLSLRLGTQTASGACLVCIPRFGPSSPMCLPYALLAWTRCGNSSQAVYHILFCSTSAFSLFLYYNVAGCATKHFEKTHFSLVTGRKICHNNTVHFFYLQRYRSGHNGADSKSVCGQPHVGSNPTRCAIKPLETLRFQGFCFCYHLYKITKWCPNGARSFKANMHKYTTTYLALAIRYNKLRKLKKG